MQISIRPELERFIDQQVKSGRFATASEAMEAGIARLMLDPPIDEFDDQDLTDLDISLEQLARGEGIDASEVHKRFREKYSGK